MIKLDATVRRESRYIAGWVLVLSLVMEAVFLVIGQWDYTVLLGNLLGGSVATFNFLLMGMTVQQALEKEEKESKDFMRTSQTLRTLMQFLAAVLGVALPCFSIPATLIPLFFPRIAIAFRPLFDKKSADNSKEV
ncbi:MAG: ATP synthase subunit I [Clostridia bacterium]|nr:ATP synthase subunit I [Clostridia bacterium]